jgi:GDPmannose 4,6-dehydratase
MIKNTKKLHRKRALICGVSGQDGAYLVKLLLSKGYEVWGTSRDAVASNFNNLHYLNVNEEVKKITMIIEDFRSVFQALKISKPDEVYHFAGQSSVGMSFNHPIETIQSITIGTINLLEACRMMDFNIRIYHAGSSECFGDTKGKDANEKTPFNPRSPYAVAKSSACWLVSNYREAYGLWACNGLLFNHESPLRKNRFVTKKIIETAVRISKGSNEKLILGDLCVSRDWGWAPEYVEAMWKMLQYKDPTDFVIATGETNTLESFVISSFNTLGLDWRDHVEQSESLIRPSELSTGKADPSFAETELNWKAKNKMDEVIKNMINAEI